MSLPVIQDGIPQLVGTVPLRTVSGVHVIFCVCVCVCFFFSGFVPPRRFFRSLRL